MQKVELTRIIDQIGGLYTKNWTGLELPQILNEIEDDMANTKLAFFSNTIHQIAQHLIADSFLVIKRLKGIDYKLTQEEDWMSSDKLKQIKWSATKNALIKTKDDLLDALQNFSDADLDNPILKDHATLYVTLHGHIQHAYYHFGQLSLLKKAIENLNKR